MTLKLLFAGDGPRDEAVVPRLVERILSTSVEPDFSDWKSVSHLRGGRGVGGYGRKLLFLLRRARDRGAVGVVATIDADADTNSQKLRDLRIARERDRAGGNLTPAALGEAISHLEAWLLDDVVAVRTALILKADTQVESPTKVKSPKDELNRMHADCRSERTVIETLVVITTELDIRRCIHAEHTGFRQFHEDVERELRPLCSH